METNGGSTKGVDRKAEDVFKSLDAIIRERKIRRPKERGIQSAKAELLRMADNKNITAPNMTLRNLDPRAHSLDEIIKCEDDREINVPKRKRDEDISVIKKKKPRQRVRFSDTVTIKEEDEEEEEDVGDTEGKGEMPEQKRYSRCVPSPWKAVSLLGEQGLLIKMVIGMIDANEVEDDSRLWRCIISCGDLQGICDSRRKVVAREMAAKDFLDKLKDDYPDAKVPKYALPDEILTDPRIFHSIEKEAVEHVHTLRRDMMVKRVGGVDVFCCKYTVDSDTFEAESPSEDDAKLAAARKAYECIVGSSYPSTPYFTGEQCDRSVEYLFSESECHQTLGAPDEAAKVV